MRLIDQLRFRWWEWADAQARPEQRLPTTVQFPVNDICNSQCQMCHIWKRKRDHEVSPEELSSILDNALFSQVRNVGINGGEPTLRRDLGELVQVLIVKLPRLRSLSLITNAIREDQVLAAVHDLSKRCSDAGIYLSVMVSLDGIGPVHDRVRGVSGNFESAVRVLDHLLASSLPVSCMIGCTLLHENVYDAEHVLSFARGRSVYARFRVGIPHRRLYTLDLKDPFELDESQKFHLACFLDELRFNYETDPGRRAFYLSLRNQIIEGKPRAAGCAWKNKGITLSSRGELAYCAVESPNLGSLLKEPGDALYWGNAGILRDINGNRCAHCLHDYDGIQDRTIIVERTLRNSLKRVPGSAHVTSIARHVHSLRRDRAADHEAREARPRVLNAPPRNARRAVLLCGWYGTETLGDKAILSGLLSSLRATGWHGEVDLASLEPYISRQTALEMPELKLRSVKTVKAAREQVANGEYGLVAIAGGPLMSPVAEIYELLGLFTEARASDTSRAILGCGVGPLGHSRRRDAAIAELLQLSQSTVLRDQASLDVARSRLGYSDKASVAADPAFIWAAQQMECSGQDTERTGPVLLALRDWHTQEYGLGLDPGTAAEMKARFEHELIVMVDEIQRLAPDWVLRPMAMNTFVRGGDDRIFFQRLFSEHPALLERIQWKRDDPTHDFAAFRRARAVVAMRFHSAVLSIASRTPYVAIDYTRGGKMAALLSNISGADPPWPLEGFSGRKCAARLVEIAGSCPAAGPTGVREAYTAAWKSALEVTEG